MFLNHFMTKTVWWNHSDGQKQKTSPWITKSLKNACKKKDTLSRKWQCIELYHTHTHTHMQNTHTHTHTHAEHTHRYTHTYAHTDTEHTHVQIQNIHTHLYTHIHTHTHTHTNDIHTNTFVSHMLYLSYCCFSLVFCSCLPSEDNLFTSKVSVMLFCNSRLMICRGAASH